MRRIMLQTGALLQLPRAVRSFYLTALWTAWRKRDQYSLHVVTRPLDLREILRIAGDATHVVELGTATAWTSIALALAHIPRRVTTVDPVVRREREIYLGLVSADVRRRITFMKGTGRLGPLSDTPVGFVFDDGSHEREDTIASFRAWSPAIAVGGHMAFHDYLDPSYPGVAEAVTELGLEGTRAGRMFVWTKR